MSTPKPRPKRRWRRRILILLALLVVAALALPGLLADSYVRGMVEALATESLGSTVVVDGLSLGWWSDIEVGRLTVHEGDAGSPVLFGSDAVHVNTGVWGLMFGGGVVRVSIEEPVIHLREDPDGGLNVMNFMARMPGSDSSDDESSSLPPRGAEVDIRGGRVVLGSGAAAVTYALVGGVSCDNLESDPVRFQIELERSAGGRLVFGGEVADWASGAVPTLTGSLEATEVDLATFDTILRGTGDVRAIGVVERLTVAAEPRGAASRMALEGRIKGLSVASEDDTFGNPIELIDVSLGALRGAGRVDGLLGTVSLPQGLLTVDRESHVAWDASAVSGRVKLNLEVGDLASLQDALEGMVPDGIEMSGRASVRGWVEGAWPLADGAPWTRRVEGVTGDLRVTVDGVDYHDTSVRDVVVGGQLSGGVLTLEGTRASVGEGVVSLSGALPITDPKSASRIDWTISPRVSIEHAVEGAGDVFVALRGAGTVAMGEETVQFTGDLGLESVSAPRMPGMALHLNDARLTFDVSANPDSGAMSIKSLHLVESDVELKIEAGSLVPEGATRRASATVTARVGPTILHRLTALADFKHAVLVTGQVEGLLDDVLNSSTARLSVTTGGIAYEGQNVARAAIDVEKAGRVIKLARLECDVGGGRLTASGSSHVDGLRDADELRIVLDGVSLDRPLSDGAWHLEGVVSGAINVTGSGGATVAGLDLAIAPARFGGSGVELVELARLDLRGKVGRGADGALTIDDTTMSGDGVSIAVSRLRMPATDGKELVAQARVDATAEWIGVVLAPWMPEGVELEDRVRMDVDGALVVGQPMGTAKGRVNLELPAVTVNRRPLKAVKLVADIANGRATVREGSVRSGQGSARLSGVIGLLPETRQAGDRIELTLTRFLFTVDQALDPAASGASRRISTTGTLNGVASVAVAGKARVSLQGTVTARSVGRHLVVGTAAPQTLAVPNLKLTFDGAWLDEGEGVLVVDSVIMSGDGTSGEIRNVRHDRSGLSIKKAFVMLPPSLLRALMMTGATSAFVPTGRTTVGVNDFSLEYDGEGAPIVATTKGVGTVRMKSAAVSTLLASDLNISYTLRGGACLLRRGSVVLSKGTVTLTPGSSFGLGPENHPFNVRGAIDGIELNEGWRTPLGVLNPILLGRTGGRDTSMEGRFDGFLDCRGTWSAASGWSRTVNGSGRVRLSNVNVKSSAVLLGLASRSDAVLGDSAATAVFGLLGERGVVGKILKPLTTDGYGIQDLDAALSIRQGRVYMTDGLTMRTADLALTVTGWGSLEGDVNYRVDTDIIARLKKRAAAKLAKRTGGGVLGGLIGAIDPLSKIMDIELGVNVTGNATEGVPAIDVGLMKPRRQ